MMKQFIAITICLLSLSGCMERRKILKDKSFSKGKWLLVNVNHSLETCMVIDDEAILQANKNDIIVKVDEGDGWTTCDGVIKLYNDGKLVEELYYLSNERVNESKAIRTAYKNATTQYIDYIDENDFQHKWDSLKLFSSQYPTRYEPKYENRKTILVYKY